MRPTIRLVLVTALRDRLFLSLYGLLGLVLGISAFLGSGAILEASEMTLVYMAASVRVVLVVGVVVFVGFHVERMFDTREIEAILARTLSRPQFVLAYWIGLATTALLLAVPVIGIILAFHISLAGAVLWAVSVILEILIILAFALFAALSFERAVPTVLATLGFYALSRLMSFLTGIAVAGQQGGVNRILNPYIEILSYSLPRLDLFAQTRWLVYGPELAGLLWLIPAQAAVYIPLLLLASSHDLIRKHF